MNRWYGILVMGMALGAAVQPARADESAEERINFDDHILPIFRNACLSCHNPDRARAGLDLSTHMGIMAGGSGGQILELGDPGSSTLYGVVMHTQEPAMPPDGGKLSDENLDLIRRWIEGGALENAGSSAPRMRPRLDLALGGAPTGKPDGPAAMPTDLRLEPYVHTPRRNAVTAMASSPWAPLLAIGGQQQVVLYNTETGRLLGVLPFEDGFPNVLGFSRSGDLLLVGGGRGGSQGYARLYNVASGQMLAQIGDEFDAVLAADISADQSLVAMGGPNRVVRVYETADGEIRHTIDRHTEWITAVAYSPDSVLLATADRGGGLHIWEAHSGNLFHSLDGHDGAITGLSFSPDSNVLASSSEDGNVRLWAMNDGRRVRNWGAHGGGALDVRFTHDGRLVTVGRDGRVKIWNAAGQEQRAIRASDEMTLAATFDHDGSHIIAADWHGRIAMWRAADGQPVAEFDANPPHLAQRIDAARQVVEQAQQRFDEHVAALSQTAAQHAQALTTHEQASEQLDLAQSQVRAMAQRLTEAAEAVDQAQAARDEAQRQVEAIQAQEGELRDRVQMLTRRSEEAAEQLQAVVQHQLEAQEAAESAMEAVSEWKRRVDEQPDDEELRQSLAEAVAAAQAAAEQNRQAAEQAAAARETVNGLAQEHAQVVTAQLEAQGRLDAAQRQLRNRTNERRQAREQHESAMRDAATTERAAAEMEQQVAQAAEQVAARAEQVQNRQGEADQSQAALEQAQRDLAWWRAGQVHLELEETRSKLSEAEQILAEHEAAVRAQEERVEAAAGAVSELREEWDSREARIAAREEAIQDAREQADIARRDQDAIRAAVAEKQTLHDEAAGLLHAIGQRAFAEPSNEQLQAAAHAAMKAAQALADDVDQTIAAGAAAERRMHTHAMTAALEQTALERYHHHLTTLPQSIEQQQGELSELRDQLAQLQTRAAEARQLLEAQQERADQLAGEYTALKEAS